MTAFYDFFRGTSHIDVDPCDTISFDNFRRFAKFLWIFSEDLDDEWIFTRVMSEGFFLEIFRVHESISRIKLTKDNCLRSNFFHDLPIRTVTIAIHRGKCDDRSFESEIIPEGFIHRK